MNWWKLIKQYKQKFLQSLLFMAYHSIPTYMTIPLFAVCYCTIHLWEGNSSFFFHIQNVCALLDCVIIHNFCSMIINMNTFKKEASITNDKKIRMLSINQLKKKKDVAHSAMTSAIHTAMVHSEENWINKVIQSLLYCSICTKPNKPKLTYLLHQNQNQKICNLLSCRFTFKDILYNLLYKSKRQYNKTFYVLWL
jgi:hypothetical protein